MIKEFETNNLYNHFVRSMEEKLKLDLFQYFPIGLCYQVAVNLNGTLSLTRLTLTLTLTLILTLTCKPVHVDLCRYLVIDFGLSLL
jgi:hypothetical protein